MSSITLEYEALTISLSNASKRLKWAQEEVSRQSDWIARIVRLRDDLVVDQDRMYSYTQSHVAQVSRSTYPDTYMRSLVELDKRDYLVSVLDNGSGEFTAFIPFEPSNLPVYISWDKDEFYKSLEAAGLHW